jgi:hypothetical protein
MEDFKMAGKNEHIEKLFAARLMMVKARREVADALATSFKRGHTESMRTQFIELQSTIEAIDRAIGDENYMQSNPDQRPGVTIRVVET